MSLNVATSPPPIAVRAHGLTDRGKVRPANEDQFLIAELARTLWVKETSLQQSPTQYGRNRGHIFLVADGVGGHRAGDVASALTVATIEAFILHLLKRFSNLQATDEPAVLEDFQEALHWADSRLAQESAHHPEFAGMGTTLTMAFVSGWKLFVFHAGDSRCYLCRGGQLRQLTADHTIAAEFARQGLIKPEEVAQNRFRHVVTSVLGGKNGELQVDIKKCDLQAGDVMLLCSDGLTDMLSDDRIAAVLQAERDPAAACARLVAAANDAGGPDNITAVVARFEAA
jgi:protein phosphatase